MERFKTKFTATFKDGYQIAKTTDDFENRAAFYNWICRNALGKGHGGLEEITCSILPA